MKIFLKFFVLIFLLINFSGCAQIQQTIKEWQEKIAKETQEKQKEKYIGAREVALQKYGPEGLKEGLIVESLIIAPKIVKPGDKVKQELQFVLLAPEEEKIFNISETIILSGNKDMIELIKRVSQKPQGIHLSTIEFSIPEDLSPGEYTLITILETGEKKRTVKGSFKVEKK
jgi:hypothetical protein